MDNQMRREKLYEMLENAEEPLTGVVLSKALNVTRQIIVSDVALLRSSGKKSFPLPGGISWQEKHRKKGSIRKSTARAGPWMTENWKPN